MSSIRIVVDGKPVPWARHQGGRTTRPFTPAKVRTYQDVLRVLAQQEMRDQAPVVGPLAMTVRVALPLPKAFSKRKVVSALAGEILPVTRPDLDNYIKVVLDALNGIVWRDDAQVVRVEARKVYALKPGMEIEVST